MTVQNPQLELTASPDALLDGMAEERVRVAAHDASRLAWSVSVPGPASSRAHYEVTLELEVPTGLLGSLDPWGGLQAYGRLDGVDEGGAPRGAAAQGELRRGVVAVSFRLARARDGFVRHCTLIRTSSASEENHARALVLWISAAQGALANARAGLLRNTGKDGERALADEFLSGQLWSVLTDCARALAEAKRVLEARSDYEALLLDPVEEALSNALREEISYREQANFTYSEPATVLQLERLVYRLRGLKKHFERVLSLEVESYQVLGRFGGWLSAAAAMLAYLWFFFWQVLLERHRSPATIGSGVIAFAIVTAIAYASRERLKEAGRNWLAGRAQSIFAQRVVRYRLPSTGRQRGRLVVAARESFSQSVAKSPDPVDPSAEASRDVTAVRFTHRGTVVRAPDRDRGAGRIRLLYRLDLSSLFPRLHDAVRGFATPDPKTGRIVILDVPRNYELPIRVSLRGMGEHEEVQGTLVLNKNGLVRVEERSRIPS